MENVKKVQFVMSQDKTSITPPEAGLQLSEIFI